MTRTIPTTDHKQFVTQVTPLLPVLQGFAFSLTKDCDGLHDLVQDTLVAAYRFWDKYEQGTNLKAWLFTIMNNLFINNQRRGNRMITVSFSEDGREWILDIGAEFEERQPAESGFGDEMQRAFFALKDEFREVLVLSDIEDMSNTEISKKLGLPEGTVKSRIHRARKALRTSLADYGMRLGYRPAARMSRNFYATKSRELV